MPYQGPERRNGHTERLEECREGFARLEQHLSEYPGVRDRLKVVEIKQEQLEKGVMTNAIIGGIIGALIGSGAAPAVSKLVSLWIK